MAQYFSTPGSAARANVRQVVDKVPVKDLAILADAPQVLEIIGIPDGGPLVGATDALDEYLKEYVNESGICAYCKKKVTGENIGTWRCWKPLLLIAHGIDGHAPKDIKRHFAVRSDHFVTPYYPVGDYDVVLATKNSPVVLDIPEQAFVRLTPVPLPEAVKTSSLQNTGDIRLRETKSISRYDRVTARAIESSFSSYVAAHRLNSRLSMEEVCRMFIAERLVLDERMHDLDLPYDTLYVKSYREPPTH